jgi:hypothetical protein
MSPYLSNSFNLFFSVLVVILLNHITGGATQNITNRTASIDELSPALRFSGNGPLEYQAYSLEDIDSLKLTIACRGALTTTLGCHPYVDKFRELSYRGPLPNSTLTLSVCDLGCENSLGLWFNSVQQSCGNDLLRGEPATTAAGRIWQGWNETCISEPKTNNNCNGLRILDCLDLSLRTLRRRDSQVSRCRGCRRFRQGQLFLAWP